MVVYVVEHGGICYGGTWWNVVAVVAYVVVVLNSIQIYLLYNRYMLVRNPKTVLHVRGSLSTHSM